MFQFKREADNRVNGLDTAALGGLAEALKGNANAGRVSFITDSRWNGAAKVSTSMSGFRVDGSLLHDGSRRFVLNCDEPRELGSTDAAAAPAEALLHALGSCIIATTNAYAALAGVKLSRLEVLLTCDLDLHGIFGLDESVRPGMSRIEAGIRIDGDADAATLAGIAKQGVRFSPVRDTVENGVSITPVIEAGG